MKKAQSKRESAVPTGTVCLSGLFPNAEAVGLLSEVSLRDERPETQITLAPSRLPMNQTQVHQSSAGAILTYPGSFA